MSKFHHSNAVLRPPPLGRLLEAAAAPTAPLRGPGSPVAYLKSQPHSVSSSSYGKTDVPRPTKGFCPICHLTPRIDNPQPRAPRSPVFFFLVPTFQHLPYPSHSPAASCSSSTPAINYPKPLQLLHAYSCTEQHVVVSMASASVRTCSDSHLLGLLSCTLPWSLPQSLLLACPPFPQDPV